MPKSAILKKLALLMAPSAQKIPAPQQTAAHVISYMDALGK